MKLMYDIDNQEPSFIVEEALNESTGEKTKKYRIKGVFSTIGERNRNGRVYPKALWEQNVQDYQKVIESGSNNKLMEYSHPARSTVDLMEAVACIDKLYIKDNYVMGEATLLDNTKANQLKSLIDNNVKISVSSRSIGTLGKGNIVEDFKLITYDIVDTPSDYNASMNGMVESYRLCEGVLESKEFKIENNEIVELKESKVDFDQKEYETALKSKFKDFLSSL